MRGHPKSTETRLIIDLLAVPCCGDPVIFDGGLEDNIPPELAARGVKPEVWKEWMTRLRGDMAKSTINSMTACLLFISVLGIPYCMVKNNQKQKLALQFQTEINTAVFEPLGLYFKFQNHRDSHWMAISLNSEDAAKLKIEGRKRTLYTKYCECGICYQTAYCICSGVYCFGALLS